jgi:hypothetical protein
MSCGARSPPQVMHLAPMPSTQRMPTAMGSASCFLAWPLMMTWRQQRSSLWCTHWTSARCSGAGTRQQRTRQRTTLAGACCTLQWCAKHKATTQLREAARRAARRARQGVAQAAVLMHPPLPPPPPPQQQQQQQQVPSLALVQVMVQVAAGGRTVPCMRSWWWWEAPCWAPWWRWCPLAWTCAPSAGAAQLVRGCTLLPACCFAPVVSRSPSFAGYALASLVTHKTHGAACWPIPFLFVCVLSQVTGLFILGPAMYSLPVCLDSYLCCHPCT